MTIPSHPVLSHLRHAVHGRVHLPDDATFESVHRPWNLAVAQPVCAVVEASDADDVARLVRFAHATGLSVAAQPSGHGATGRAAGAILLRTGRLDRIDIDPAAKTATIGAGVRSGDLQRAAAAHGLTALPGSSPVVTVVGAALGGGLSWFGRAFGWMADSILAADVVTAEGTVRRVTPETDPELMWALKGGGGDLAIVTALQLRLHDAPAVFGGRQLWPEEHAHDVMRAYRTMTASAPRELTLWLELLHFPGGEPLIAIDATYLGPEADARAAMCATADLPEPLSDTRTMMSAADLGTITAEPTAPGPGQSRGELLTRLDDSAVEALLDEPIAPLLTVQIRHLGGSLAQPNDNPHGGIREPYAIYMFGTPTDDRVSAQIAQKQAALAEVLPVTGRKPITFLRPEEQLSDALPTTSIDRLRALKSTLDPAHTIRGNVGIVA